MLESVLSTVLFCGKQNLPLRGHRDDSAFYQDDSNCRNFQALLEFRVESGDTNLKNHFTSGPKNATYRSKTIQNEIIDVIGDLIVEDVVSRIKKNGGYFLVSADETADRSNQEQLVVTVRYFDSDKGIVEELLGFVEVSEGTTGEQLTESILEILTSSGLDLTFMRGQCYDGAGNMSGKNKGNTAISFQL